MFCDFKLVATWSYFYSGSFEVNWCMTQIFRPEFDGDSGRYAYNKFRNSFIKNLNLWNFQ